MSTNTDGVSAMSAELGGYQPRAYFSRLLLEAALMTPEQEATVMRQQCPKCHKKLQRTSEGGGIRFSQCTGCGDIWCVNA